MAINYWDELLKFDSNKLSNNELSILIEGLRKEAGFLKQQGDRLDLYLIQLGDNIITEKEFRSLMLDIKDLTELELIRQRVKNIALAQKTLDVLGKLLIQGVVSVIKI